MTASIRVEVSDLGVGEALRRIETAAGDLTVLMDRIGAQMEDSVAERFEEGRGPDGAPWPVSRPARLGGHPTLVRTGRLRDSITREAGPRHVEVGSNVEFAAIHQFGGEIRPKTKQFLAIPVTDEARRAGSPLNMRLVFVQSLKGQPMLIDPESETVQFLLRRKVTMPARPFLGFGAEDEAAIGGIVERFFARLWS